MVARIQRSPRHRHHSTKVGASISTDHRDRPNRPIRLNCFFFGTLRDGQSYMAFGTPGGDQQDQWSLHVFLRHVHFGMNLQAAIDAPAFHTEHAPSSFYPRGARPGHLAMEGRFSNETIEELRRRRHEVELCDDWSLGRVVAAAEDGEILRAAANPRFMQNYATGR